MRRFILCGINNRRCIMKVIFYILLLYYALSSCLFALEKNEDIDIIYLKNGSIIRGLITDEKDNSIIIELGDKWKEINRSDILKIRKNENIKRNLSQPRLTKITTGFCTNYIFGYDFQDKQGYGMGPGFRVGYCINILPRLEVESSYTFSTHESDTADAPTININAFDLNCKYILLNQNKIKFYLNLGIGLDLFSTEEVSEGVFSYLPQFGAGSYIYISKTIDLDIAANTAPVAARYLPELLFLLIW